MSADSTTPAATFGEKAPQLSCETLADVVRQDVLAPAVRETTEEIWLHGAFADPESGIDREDLETPGGLTGLSDVDVFVVLDGWDAATLDTRFTASQHGLLCRLAAQDELAVHTDADPTDRLDRPPVPKPIREADLLPADALETTIQRAERTTFYARDFDRDLLQFRALDLTLGGPAAFEWLLGDQPKLRVWPTDGG